jgi:hypothetical protein
MMGGRWISADLMQSLNNDGGKVDGRRESEKTPKSEFFEEVYIIGV